MTFRTLDMPNFPWASRRDASSISDASLAALLAGAKLPADSAPQLRPLADALAELSGRPGRDELSGEVRGPSIRQIRASGPDPTDWADEMAVARMPRSGLFPARVCRPATKEKECR